MTDAFSKSIEGNGEASDIESLREQLTLQREQCEQLTRDAEGSRQELESRIQFEQMLGDICASLINLSPDQLDAALDGNLHSLVEFLGVDRSTLFELFDDGTKVRPTHSWVRPGLPAAELFEPMDEFRFYVGRLRRGQIVIMSSVDELPPEADFERDYCLHHGVKSHVGVPLMIGADFIGSIGFTFLQQEHNWSQDMLGRLRLIGEAFANAILRKRWGQAQAELATQMERTIAQRTALAEARALQLQRLTLQMSQVAQRERRRVAMLLHEGLQQVLVGIKLYLASGACASIEQGPRRRIGELLDEATGISRTLTAELCPPVLYSAGLIGALHWLERHAKETFGIQLEMRLDEQAEPQSQELREFLFEAARELVSNVARHAGTRQATLILEKTNHNHVRLCVLDKGIGFDPAQLDDPASDAFGLFSLRERLALLGGEMRITSRPGGGVCVLMTLPMSPSANA